MLQSLIIVIERLTNHLVCTDVHSADPRVLGTEPPGLTWIVLKWSSIERSSLPAGARSSLDTAWGHSDQVRSDHHHLMTDPLPRYRQAGHSGQVRARLYNAQPAGI